MERYQCLLMLRWSSSHDCACPQIYPYLVLNDVTTINECRREERVLQLCRLLNYCLKKDKVQITCVCHFCMRAHAYSCGLLHYNWYDNGVTCTCIWCFNMKSTLASHSCFPKLNFHVFACIAYFVYFYKLWSPKGLCPKHSQRHTASMNAQSPSGALTQQKYWVHT